MILKKKHIESPIIFILLGLIMGLFVHNLSNLPIKWSVTLVSGLLLVIFVLATGISRNLLIFSLIVLIVLFFDFHLVYVEHNGIANGLTISLLDIILIVMLFRRTLYYRQNPVFVFEKNSLSARAKFLAIGLLVTALLSTVNSPDILLTILGIIQFAKMILLFYFIISEVKFENDFSFISLSLVCSLAILSLFCLMQYITQTNFTIDFQVITTPSWYIGGFQPVGTTGSSNVTASQLIALMPFGLAALIRNKNFFFRLIAFSSVISAFVILILTQSRAGWLACALSLGIFLYLVLLKRLLKLRYALIIIILIIATGVTFFINIFEESSIQDISNPNTLYDRKNLLLTSFRMIKAYPLVGVGFNNYTNVMQQYTPPNLAYTWIYLVHNNYMLIWSEIGTIGFIIYILFIFYIYRNILFSLKLLVSNLSLVGISIISSLIALNIHMFFESFAGGSAAFLFWFMCAFAVSLGEFAINKIKIDS